MAKARKKAQRKSTRTDERISTLIYMNPDVLQAVRDAAAADDMTAWLFIERAVKKALKWKDE